jgi:two-component system, OmpR family, sensor histidine kinase BaeS
MPTPLRTRLTLSYLAVLLAGMSLAVLLAWRAVEQLYLETQRENLLAQARLTAGALQGAALPVQSPESYLQTSNALPGIHGRVLGEQGTILSLPFPSAGGPVSLPPAENVAYVSPVELLQRPEIQKALRGAPASEIRSVAAAAGRRVLYAAAPIFTNTGEITGIVYLATPLPPNGLPPELMLQLAGALLLAALLAGLAGTLLARRIARPLEGLARAAEAVSRGDLEQEVPPANDISELGSLAAAFNSMTASLRQSNQAKNAFIADVTHELRTPLTVIKGTIETLEDGALDDRQGRGPLLAAMQHETDRLIRLVNQLLVLARADAGALQLDIQPIDLAALAHARCEQLSVLASQRRVELHVVEAGADSQGGYLAPADADRLAQVLDNLLDNAIRHAPEGSSVTVTVQRNDAEVECAVSDSGPGIPARHLPFIFERFYRADSARDRHSGGTGLGLAIARALLLAQGGRVEAQSTEGRGTSIRFCLPAATRLPEN